MVYKLLWFGVRWGKEGTVVLKHLPETDMLTDYQLKTLKAFWDKTQKLESEGLHYMVAALRPDLAKKVCGDLMETLLPLVAEDLAAVPAAQTAFLQAQAAHANPAFTDPADDGSAAMDFF